MRRGAIAFLGGVVVLQSAPDLPSLHWLWLWGLAGAVLLLVRRPWPGRTLLLGLAAGLSWSLLHAHWTLAPRLDPALENRDLVVEGRISGIPDREAGVRFAFHIERVVSAPDGAVPRRVRLAWYEDAPALGVGERWRLRVRLKAPRGFMNPGGFDYEGWLFQNGFRAVGSVRNGPGNERLAPPEGLWRLAALRQGIGEAIGRALERGPYHGIVTALATGDRQHIARAQWETLRRTGTGHLVAISGLHIALVSGAVFFLVRRLAGRWGERWPADKWAAVAALLAATLYAALAGFAVPTQRALVMLVVVLGAIVLERTTAASRTLATALLLVLILDPLAVLAAGFWLSFAAVAAILYGMSARRSGAAWRQWPRLQWVLALGLVPVSLIWFQRTSLIAPAANLLAVPVVGMVVVPLTLIGTALLGLSQGLGGALLGLAHGLLALLWPVLEWLAALPWAEWRQATPPLWTSLLAALGALLLLAPRGLPGRWVGPVLALPLILYTPPRPPYGGLHFTLLDVGQGMAVVVRTQAHALVYDTGPRYPSGFDTGTVVVVPYLHHLGIERLDRLVLSHSDIDHIGGAAAVLAAYPDAPVLSGEPDRVPGAATPCLAGQRWNWDGVAFEILHPPGPGLTDNDASCVLRIEAAGTLILLPGDIGRRVEQDLARTSPERLRAHLLVAPHHGSRSSSSAALIDAVRPELVLFPAGYRNRYHFPAGSVVRRYEAAGARLLDTPSGGAISLWIDAEGRTEGPQAHRVAGRRYWTVR